MTKLILAASAALLIAAPAFAETAAQDAPVQAVSAKGVNFANREQARRFYVKLQVAAASVCNADASCAREVMAQAVKAADKPVLTALYNAGGDSSRAFAGNDQ
jgi:UrcA family protein